MRTEQQGANFQSRPCLPWSLMGSDIIPPVADEEKGFLTFVCSSNCAKMQQHFFGIKLLFVAAPTWNE